MSAPMLYRHQPVGLVRAARAASSQMPNDWPDLAGGTVQQWRSWLADVWTSKDTAEAIALASPSLARNVQHILACDTAKAKEVRRVVLAVCRYVLRQASRPTPFGLFAGVAEATFGQKAKVRWGSQHRAIVRADADWLADMIDRLESCPELLEHVPVTFSDLCVVRGDRLAVPAGRARIDVGYTPAVRAVERAARLPIRVVDLIDAVIAEFPGTSRPPVLAMVAQLIERGFLVSRLRAPLTVTDPLGHLLPQLDMMDADQVPAAAAMASELYMVRAAIFRHNQAPPCEQPPLRAALVEEMRRMAPVGRSPIAVDLRLDCDLQLPERVGGDMAAAATALLRLTAHPHGQPSWLAYHAEFIDRYGIGTLVPLTDLLAPDLGLGAPATFPDSPYEAPARPATSARDERLLVLVQAAVLREQREVVLDEQAIDDLAVEELAPYRIPPHVEIATRIHADSIQAIEAGEYTITVTPARSAGTMTGRFAAVSDKLAQALSAVPTTEADALPVQVSCPPAYPHAENVARGGRILEHLLPLGEHRDLGVDMVSVDDLAVVADWHRLHLMSLSRRRPVEPLVFHALRVDKQLPAVARFLIELPRAFTAAYTEFDWGAASHLPYLPRVRYGRIVLARARWRLTRDTLPGPDADWPVWESAFTTWRQQWRVPDVVELRDDDRMLRLTLDEPAHATLLRRRLNKRGDLLLVEAAPSDGCRWLDGHEHEIVALLTATHQAAPSPMSGRRMPVASPGHGQLPGSAQSRWLFAKLFAHPDRQSEILARLPELLADLGDPAWWFMRYRSGHDPHHLRLRLRTRTLAEHSHLAAALGGWAEQLRRHGLVYRLTFETYLPEIGRYGDGRALEAAEQVFVADSAVVAAQLRHLPATRVAPAALAAAGMVDIVRGFTGSNEAAMRWLIDHPAPAQQPAPDRQVAAQAALLADTRSGYGPLAERAHPDLVPLWGERRAAVSLYPCHLAGEFDSVLESLLHLHHVRAIGLDRSSERTCRQIARAIAVAWRARMSGP